MESGRELLSPEFREATRVALALQIPFAILCLLLLDGGRMALICGVAMLGFWCIAGVIAVRRRWSPTFGDLFFWRWGFVACFALAVLMASLADR